MTTLALQQIRTDGGTQPRQAIDADVVDDYGEAKRNGATFPPVTVFYDGSDYWLADGFHRVAAARQMGATGISADVRQGSRRDAILHSVGANADHGLRRTNADKRRAVLALLHDKEWSQWSDREIARRCAVGHAFVSKLRAESSLSTKDSEPRTYTTKHGNTSTMNTTNIGRRETAPESEEDPDTTEWPEEEPDVEAELFDEDEPDDEPASQFTTDVEEAYASIKRYVSEVMIDLPSDNDRHELTVNLLKHFRNLSIEYNRRFA